jgi:hypothetical protein
MVFPLSNRLATHVFGRGAQIPAGQSTRGTRCRGDLSGATPLDISAPGWVTNRDSVGGAIAPFAARVVLPIAGLVAVAQYVAAIAGQGYWFDEVYMLGIGRNHLDWGSADQPPLAPALSAVTDAIAPASILAVRAPAILATAAAVVIAALIAREFGGDPRAQVLTAGAQATGIWASLAGHWLTPCTLEPVQRLALLWLLIRWIRLREDRLLLALAGIAGSRR